MVAVFIPGWKLTPSACVPDHQSQVVLPGLIHDVSTIALGGFRLMTMFDSTSRPGCVPIMMTRHGDRIGVVVWTASPGSSMEGESLANNERAALGVERIKYMPA